MGDGALIRRQAQDDVHRVVRSGGAVVGQFQPVGHKLHHSAHGGGRQAVTRGGGAVDLQFPVDAGGRQAVVDVDHVGHLLQLIRDGPGHGVQPRGVGGRQLHLDRLAGRRPGIGYGNLHIDAGNAGHGDTQIGKDRVGVLAFAPVDEFVLDHPDHIGGDLIATAPGLAGAGIDRLDPRPAKDAVLGLLDQRVLLVNRQVAARVDVEKAVIGLHAGEEFHPLAVGAIGVRHRDQKRERGQHHGPRVPDRAADEAHIQAVTPAILFRDRSGDDGADGRREDQRIDERGRQSRDQRDRHILHELAHDAGPEQQRREGRDPRCRRRQNRPGHLVRGLGEGGALVHPLGHAAFGIFGDDDRIVDQHADGKDQAEQHDDIDRQPRHLQPEDADQERGRNGQPDQDRGTARQREEDDDEDQDNSRQDRVLKVAQKLADGGGLVLAEGDLGPGGQRLLKRLRHLLHRIDRIDKVGAGALRYLDGDGGLSVKPGDRLGVLGGVADRGDIARPHGGVAARQHRQVGHILDRLDQRGDLDGIAPLGPFQRTRGDQLVIGRHALNHSVEADTV